jgi:NAD dependent epimerase/dehydratase family enzyme
MSDETRPSDGGAGRSPCVFVTGGTGLIGRKVSLALRERRARVVVLTRDAAAAAQRIGPGVELVEGDPTIAGAWQEVLAQANAVVNLAGEPIFAGRWTKARKRRIRASRVQAATNVAQAAAGGTPEVLVSASAIGYYGPRGDEQLTETAYRDASDRRRSGRGRWGACGDDQALSLPCRRTRGPRNPMGVLDSH